MYKCSEPVRSAEEKPAIFGLLETTCTLFSGAKGLSPPAIADALAAEGLSATKQDLTLLIKRYHSTGTLESRTGSGRLSKITPQVKTIVESQTHEDSKTTAV